MWSISRTKHKSMPVSFVPAGRKSLELLPPTNDALSLHLKRSNYQAKIWLNASDQHFQSGNPLDTGGRTLEDDKLKPMWMRTAHVPTACIQLVLWLQNEVQHGAV